MGFRPRDRDRPQNRLEPTHRRAATFCGQTLGGTQRVFTLLPDGTFGYSNRGSAQNGDGFITSMTYAVA